MKKITILFFLMIFSFGYSQDQLLGFETTETGGVDGGPFGNGPAPIVEVGSGTNTTQVLKIVGNPDGEPWQGINLNLSSPTNLTATQTMTMDVYSDVAITFLVKATGGVGGPATVAAAATHPGGSTWQTISFTFNTVLDGQGAPASGIYNKFVIHTYWVAGETSFFPGGNPIPRPARTFYVDNIKGPLGTPPVIPSPATAAPTPPARAAADVKSIFSNAYANVAVLNYAGADGQPSNDNTYNTSWCGANTSLVQIAGNDTNKIVGLGCEGIAFFAGRFSAAGFTHFHMDIWTPTETLNKSFNFKFSNWSGGTAETNAYEYSANNANILPSTNPGTWISIDIPVSSFTAINAPNNTDFTQFVITSDLGIVYYDNLYLHKNTVLSNSTFETSKVSLYPNPTSDNITIDAKADIETVSIFNLLGQEIMTISPKVETVTLNISDFQAGIYLVKTTVDGTTSSSRVIKQ